jgi:hypothetical protein
MSFTVLVDTSELFAVQIRNEAAKWSKVSKTTASKPNNDSSITKGEHRHE